jgi:lysophospholipase L1-like esterase
MSLVLVFTLAGIGSVSATGNGDRHSDDRNGTRRSGIWENIKRGVELMAPNFRTDDREMFEDEIPARERAEPERRPKILPRERVIEDETERDRQPGRLLRDRTLDREDVTDTEVITGSYAALGDSVAAGQGLNASAGQCGRSSLAYPAIVAEEAGLTLDHIACSGATARSLSIRQRVDGPNIPAQLNAAFASGTPELITITAGANDVQWDRFLLKCYRAECGTTADTFLAEQLRTALRATLHLNMRDIERRGSGSPPTVILTGYYNPVSLRCATENEEITRDEIRWLNRQTSRLNSTIRAVSLNYDFVRFAPVTFSSHDICSNDPWVQDLNDSAPFHPNEAGHEAIANSILRRF